MYIYLYIFISQSSKFVMIIITIHTKNYHVFPHDENHDENIGNFDIFILVIFVFIMIFSMQIIMVFSW